MSVPDLLNDARAYTAGLAAEAGAAMDSAIASASAVGFLLPNIEPVALPAAPPDAIALDLPALVPVDLNLPAAPDAQLLFQDIPPIELPVAPVFDAEAPDITIPSSPSALAAFAAQAPAINTALAFPEPPAALMNPVIDAPILRDRDEPDKPQTLLPAFDAVRPTDTSVAPDDLDGTLNRTYRGAVPEMVSMVNGFMDAKLADMNPEYAAQMARIEAQLTTYLDGGTGLKPAVEDAIYSRSRGKGDAEARRVRDALYAEAAGRGFTMPPGSLTSSIQQARQAAADANAKAAADIAIAQAEMEQKNLQFAVTTSSSLRTAMLNASISYMQGLVSLNAQALDYAKAVLGAVIETYSIARQFFVTKVEVYKADAMVFETKLRAALAGIDLYKAEISALEAMTQVDRSKVEVYRARVETLTSLSNVYRAQIEAVQGRVGLEKLKLDVFQSQVQAFTAQVQAKNAEWQGYSAAIEGENAKVKAFNGLADAYSAEVNGFKAKAEALSETVRAAAVTNDSRSRSFAAAWQGYQATVSALGDVARTKLENQRQSVIAFQAKTQAQVANAQVASEYYRATSSVALKNAELRLQAQVEGAHSQRAFGQTLATLGTANANIYSGLAAAALSGMNTLAAETLTA